MQVKPIITLILFFLFSTNLVQSQSLSKAWYCGKNKVCLTIDSTTKCFRVNDLYGVDNCKRTRYKRKGNVIIVKMYTNQTILGWEKEKTEFLIDKLTNNSLYLTLISSEDIGLLETMGMFINDQIVFDFVPDGCDNTN